MELPEPRKQAVVIIHGIGEQRPMDTLRKFVDAVVLPDGEGRARYYNKPDEKSGSFELRRLVTFDNRPKTEFYEFYWAHRMPRANWARITSWLRLLVFRPLSQIPEQLRALWWTAWAGFLVAAAYLLAVSAFAFWPELAPSWWPKPSLAVTTVPLIALLFAGAQAIVLSYIGDAAIYLSTHPTTVAARQEIRAAGVALLEELHADPEYERIIIVGHSLGSVIGYDIIKNLWLRMHALHGSPDRPGDEALKRVQSLAGVDRETIADRKAWARSFQDAVLALWREQRSQGFKWLVTDFVTLGSPLAHATLLLADNKDQFQQRVDERELPVSPPMLDHYNKLSYSIPFNLPDGSKRNVAAIHDGAPFAVTRWTNIYFPCRNLLFGDIVGGPLAGHFGPGVVDVPVKTKRWGGFLSHTFYWPQYPADCSQAGDPLTALTAALKLNLRRSERSK
jgi:hypothetical protein